MGTAILQDTIPQFPPLQPLPPFLSFPLSSSPYLPLPTSKWGGYSTYLQPEESPLFADWILAAKLLPDEAIHLQSLIMGLVGSEDLSENVMEIPRSQ